MNNQARLIKFDELKELLDLYRYLNTEDPEIDSSDLCPLWEEIFNDPHLYYVVVKKNKKIVSSCTLAIIKNLTRNANPYGIVENVVTHPDYRRQGLGTKVINKAINICKGKDCYKVMLLTGSKKESTLKFYEKAGFDRDVKTGFYKKLK
ncbi:MAG: GNAT family N-acetyltransferase [Halanaerobiales bacterium]